MLDRSFSRPLPTYLAKCLNRCSNEPIRSENLAAMGDNATVDDNKNPVAGRLMSLDALRGFDMFWIIGGGTFVRQLDEVVNRGGVQRSAWIHTLAAQCEHKNWQGMAFEDLIFPLFVFIAGVSIVFSLTKEIQLHGKRGACWRILRRATLLFALGVFYNGGFAHPWPDVRLTGVLQRIALCYLGAAAVFCTLRPRAIMATVVLLLAGYWALLTFVPFPDIKLDKATVEQAARQLHSNDLAKILQNTQKTTRGSYEKGLNLANYLDARYLPGRKYDRYWCPEGLLSTLPAIATCLLGVLAGMLLRNPQCSERKKVLWLAVLGIAGVLLGFLWGLQFPVIKKLWTSSYVLVAGGYSALLLAAFYCIVDICKLRVWCRPLVWIGANSIAIYLLSPLLDFREAAARLAGGDVRQFCDAHLAPGAGELVLIAVSYVLIFALMGFLYRRKIFVRL
jgi:predicted acyltransferase